MGVEKVLRRSLVTAAVLAGVALIIAASLGYVLVGVGVVIGLGLGALNALGMRRMVNRAAAIGLATKRAMAGASLSRLGVITAAVFVLLLVNRDVAFGALGGIVLFQIAILVNSSRVLLSQMRREAGM